MKATNFAAAATGGAVVAVIGDLGSQILAEVGQSITLFQKLLKRQWPVFLRM